MDDLEHFEILEDYAVFRPTGQVSVEHAADMVTRAIAFARARRIRKLLVDASKLTGFELPSLGSLYFFIHDWARVAEGGVRVAFVTRPELIERQGFGRIVANNVSFFAEVFTTPEDALAWLHQEAVGEPREMKRKAVNK
jgi:hypothetical protein